jgi:outer membrane protein insertion porin family
VYNQELLEQRLRFSQDGRDISSLYMDDGYLFFNVEPTEVAISGDSIDLEMRMYEGAQATIDKVTIKGNDRTHEHVIRRELRTLPGAKFSRSQIIRSQREIIGLGYFNQEALGINTPVNPQRGTVDIEYKVEEKPSDQLELSAGWGGYGVVGTLGVSFNNFSVRNIFKKESWSPLPQGDGQRVSIRAQSNGKFFQSYSASFTEPWLGGKRPTSLTVSGAYSKYSNYYATDSYFGIFQGTVALGKRLKWPDDNFITSTSIEYQRYDVNNYQIIPGLTNGNYNNISISQTFSRNSISDPLFPKSGSRLTLIVQLTPPYSLINGKQYEGKPNSDKFQWLEFNKWRFNAEWYTPVAGKLVLKTSAKLGSLGIYNSHVGYPPFGRYILGGDGLANRQAGLTGNEILALRGYETTDFPSNNQDGTATTGVGGGGTTFAKYTAELRYPISLNPSSTIYALLFAEGGNVWSRPQDFRPFDVRRAAGGGVRVFLPMFGTLGFDYGFGFDKPSIDAKIDRKLTDYARFSIILGFEPD